MALSFPVLQILFLLYVCINLYRYDHRHDLRGGLLNISSGKLTNFGLPKSVPNDTI
jgi:hypothetical protein